MVAAPGGAGGGPGPLGSHEHVAWLRASPAVEFLSEARGEGAPSSPGADARPCPALGMAAGVASICCGGTSLRGGGTEGRREGRCRGPRGAVRGAGGDGPHPRPAHALERVPRGGHCASQPRVPVCGPPRPLSRGPLVFKWSLFASPAGPGARHGRPCVHAPPTPHLSVLSVERARGTRRPCAGTCACPASRSAVTCRNPRSPLDLGCAARVGGALGVAGGAPEGEGLSGQAAPAPGGTGPRARLSPGAVRVTSAGASAPRPGRQAATVPGAGREPRSRDADAARGTSQLPTRCGRAEHAAWGVGNAAGPVPTGV